MSGWFRRDSGAVTIFFTILAFAWIVIFASVIVGGAKIRYLQLANNIAAEAARAGGQAIELGTAINGGAKVVDVDRYRAAVTAYLTKVDDSLPGSVVTGTVARPTPGTVEVIVTVTYRSPVAVPWEGASGGTVTGRARATLIVR
jgi:hypothetical protein